MNSHVATFGYGCCKFNESTLVLLQDWLSKNEDFIVYPIDVEDAHSTIIYSRVNFKLPVFNSEDFSSWEFKPIEFDLLPSFRAGRMALVIILEAPKLVELHNAIVESGAQHNFDEFIPHITLSYSVDPDFDLSQLELPDFKFELDRINFEALILNE